jgi:hypothetical protein
LHEFELDAHVLRHLAGDGDIRAVGLALLVEDAEGRVANIDGDSDLLLLEDLVERVFSARRGRHQRRRYGDQHRKHGESQADLHWLSSLRPIVHKTLIQFNDSAFTIARMQSRVKLPQLVRIRRPDADARTETRRARGRSIAG